MIGAYELTVRSSSASQTVSLQLPTNASIIAANMTVVGRAAGIPCASLRLPCPYPTNKSSISATLIRYGGTSYYVSFLNANNVRYAVWYDNSTYYCVSPKVEWANSCPGV